MWTFDIVPVKTLHVKSYILLKLVYLLTPPIHGPSLAHIIADLSLAYPTCSIDWLDSNSRTSRCSSRPYSSNRTVKMRSISAYGRAQEKRVYTTF